MFVGGIGLFEELSSLKFQLKIEGLKESIVLNNARLVLFRLFRSDRNKSIVFKWTLFLLISWRARDTQLCRRMNRILLFMKDRFYLAASIRTIGNKIC